jgi:hypothetical protein
VCDERPTVTSVPRAGFELGQKAAVNCSKDYAYASSGPGCVVLQTQSWPGNWWSQCLGLITDGAVARVTLPAVSTLASCHPPETVVSREGRLYGLQHVLRALVLNTSHKPYATGLSPGTVTSQ